MYMSTEKSMKVIMDRLNTGLEVIVTDGTVNKEVKQAEIYSDVLSVSGTDNNISWSVEIPLDSFDDSEWGTVEIDNILYIAPQWWIEI